MIVDGGVWVGIDAGKFTHHAAAVDSQGQTLWSVKVPNTQEAAEKLVGRARKPGTAVGWAADSTSSAASLLLAYWSAAGSRWCMCRAGWSTG